MGNWEHYRVGWALENPAKNMIKQEQNGERKYKSRIIKNN